MEKNGKRNRRRFSAKYKAETVRLVERSSKSIGQIALELGIGETALRRWVEQAEVEAGRGPEGALKRSERGSPTKSFSSVCFLKYSSRESGAV